MPDYCKHEHIEVLHQRIHTTHEQWVGVEKIHTHESEARKVTAICKECAYEITCNADDLPTWLEHRIAMKLSYAIEMGIKLGAENRYECLTHYQGAWQVSPIGAAILFTNPNLHPDVDVYSLYKPFFERFPSVNDKRVHPTRGGTRKVFYIVEDLHANRGWSFERIIEWLRENHL